MFFLVQVSGLFIFTIKMQTYRIPREGEAAQKIQGGFSEENLYRFRVIQAAEADSNSWEAFWETCWHFDR